MSAKFTLSLLLGAALGGAIAHFLNTPEGKALLCRIKSDANGLAGTFSRKQPEDEYLLVEEQPTEHIVVVGLEA